MKVEVRVPTYRRPYHLRRCLESLINQTHRDWVAVVFDDCPDRSAANIVKGLNDSRVRYSPNGRNLGCYKNIDQAFQSVSLAEGGWACVVEDDNWLLPECIEQNLAELNCSECKVVLRNQCVVLDQDNAEYEFTENTTRGAIFGGANRKLGALDVRASMFFCEGLSNGGVFWRLGECVDFVVGDSVRFSPMQEYCRSIQLNEDVLYCSDPLAVFSLPVNGSTTREGLENRCFNRGRQAILERLIRHHGDRLIRCARDMVSDDPNGCLEVSAILTDIGWLPGLNSIPLNRIMVSAWGKGVAKRFFIDDPLAEFWRCGGSEKITRVN